MCPIAYITLSTDTCALSHHAPTFSHCFLYYNLCQNKHNQNYSKAMQVYRWGLLFHCTTSFINSKHETRLCRLWKPSNLQGITCPYIHAQSLLTFHISLINVPHPKQKFYYKSSILYSYPIEV